MITSSKQNKTKKHFSGSFQPQIGRKQQTGTFPLTKPDFCLSQRTNEPKVNGPNRVGTQDSGE
jgi:hypothetical protein